MWIMNIYHSSAKLVMNMVTLLKIVRKSNNLSQRSRIRNNGSNRRERKPLKRKQQHLSPNEKEKNCLLPLLDPQAHHIKGRPFRIGMQSYYTLMKLLKKLGNIRKEMKRHTKNLQIKRIEGENQRKLNSRVEVILLQQIFPPIPMQGSQKTMRKRIKETMKVTRSLKPLNPLQ